MTNISQCLSLPDKWTIVEGDCRDVLQTLPTNTFQAVITSPPYFGLRDYGHTDQIGQEDESADYVDTLVDVFREVRKVLHRDGVVWLNLGDSYGGMGQVGRRDKLLGEAAHSGIYRDTQAHWEPEAVYGRSRDGQSKSLLCIPWRAAIALQNDGWYLRSDIIWHKSNPMPESVKDRPTRSHEYIFMFSQSQSYYYDDAGKSNSRDVWQFPVANCPEAHFAVFPRALVQKCLSLSTRAGDWVLDPFAGMGTVIDVALANGNRAIGIELSHDYCERATKNIRHGKELFA